ncbi:unknown [Clostridium sp. CAG:448]|nr:unknown [Clostridium sp. CAG:448]
MPADNPWWCSKRSFCANGPAPVPGRCVPAPASAPGSALRARSYTDWCVRPCRCTAVRIPPACRLCPRAPPPGSSFPGFSACCNGAQTKHPACRFPCRRHWSPPSPARGRTQNPPDSAAVPRRTVPHGIWLREFPHGTGARTRFPPRCGCCSTQSRSAPDAPGQTQAFPPPWTADAARRKTDWDGQSRS